MSRALWYLVAIAFGAIVGKVLGAVAGEALTRLVLSPGQQFNADGDPTYIVTMAEYNHRLVTNGNVCSWIGAVVGVFVSVAKMRDAEEANAKYEKNKKAA